MCVGESNLLPGRGVGRQGQARVLIARHADTTYAQPEVMSDEGGWLTDLGKRQAADLGERLATEAICAVYTSHLSRAQQTATIASARLALTPSTIDGVHEVGMGAFAGTPAANPQAREVMLAWLSGDLGRRLPGADCGTEVIARFVKTVETLAAKHQGKTVLLVSHGGVMLLAIPKTVTNLRPDLVRDTFIPNCAVAEVIVSPEAWHLANTWPGRTRP